MMPDRSDIALEKVGQMTDIHILAIDLAKLSFQVCGTAAGGAVLREQEPCIVAMEACATSHLWGRFAHTTSALKCG